jgi:phenylacetate-CoA ligase
MPDIDHEASAERHPASAPDYLPVNEMHELQLRRLQGTVSRAYQRIELYRERMAERKVSPAEIRTLEDLTRLPFTVKSDLRDTYPFGLFASPLEEVVRLHASSGTTGKPIVVAYTHQDIGVWTDAMTRTLAACGLGRGDIIQNAYGYGLFTGGLGAHYGAEALGATVIPISSGNTDRQIMVMKDFNVTAICCTPTYFLHLLDRAAQLGVEVRELPLRVGVFGAEPWTDSLRRHIEAAAGIKAYDIYGLTEITGPGVGIECRCQAGLHIIEDHFYPEIINPASGELVAEGEEGELVLTTLSKQAMPLLRYRTRDISAFLPGPCPCGRTLRRILRISRRSDDMVIIRGVNVFPSQVESALLAVEGMLPHYQIILTREAGLDQMEVQVEVTPPVLSDRVAALENLHNKLAQALHQTLGLRVKVRLVAPQTLKRSEGKAQRVIDHRTV